MISANFVKNNSYVFFNTSLFDFNMCCVLLIAAYHFAFQQEIIITQQASPMVKTSYESPIVIRDSAENTDFTVAVDHTIDAVVHIQIGQKQSTIL